MTHYEDREFRSMSPEAQELQIRVWSLEFKLRQAEEAMPDLQKQLRLLDRARRRVLWLDRLARRLKKEVAWHATHYPSQDMPPVPDPMSKVSEKPIFPASPGIYFIWCDQKVAYVGQSGNLSRRVTSSHERIAPNDWASFLEFHEGDLTFVECYYIWRCKPERNFGQSRKRIFRDLQKQMQ